MNPRIVAVNGSRKEATVSLTSEEITIGRESASTVCLNHASVSRRHCLIRREHDDFKIFDLDSYNGTFVNGIPVKEQILAHADQVRIGSIELLFLTEEGEQTTSGHQVRWDNSNPLTQSAKQLLPETLLHQTEQVTVSNPAHERMARDLGVVLRIATRINQLCHTQELVRRSEEHTSELQSRGHLVCRLLLEKKK